MCANIIAKIEKSLKQREKTEDKKVKLMYKFMQPEEKILPDFFILMLNMLIIKSTWKNKQARVARKTLKEKASPTRPKNNIKTL